jgi:hypothetical protein
MARGIKKTNLSAAEIQRRRDLALSNSLKMKGKTRAKKVENNSCNKP